jgi:hypothetical protein
MNIKKRSKRNRTTYVYDTGKVDNGARNIHGLVNEFRAYDNINYATTYDNRQEPQNIIKLGKLYSGSDTWWNDAEVLSEAQLKAYMVILEL